MYISEESARMRKDKNVDLHSGNMDACTHICDRVNDTIIILSVCISAIVECTYELTSCICVKMGKKNLRPENQICMRE